MATMKAVTCTKYGPPEVLKLVELERPTPKSNEILIKIHATTAHIGDTKVRGFRPGLGPIKDFFFKPLMRLMLGFTGPRNKILGMELAGVVEAIGDKVSKWRIGDQIFAATGMQFGAYAEYICLPENGIIAKLPATMTFGEAATLPNGAITALLIIRKAKIQAGQRVLVYGASGSVGTFALQIAKSQGAKVTGVCGTGNLELVKSLGADEVIDYTASDFTQKLDTYQVIFDAVGKADPSRLKKFLSKGGIYLNVLTSSDGLQLKIADLFQIKDLVEAKKLRTVIDRTYTLDDIVAAHSYVESGHKKGNVVISVCP